MVDRTFTVEQVKEILHKSTDTVQGYFRSGKLRATKVGKSWLATQEELDAFITGKSIATTPSIVDTETEAGIKTDNSATAVAIAKTARIRAERDLALETAKITLEQFELEAQELQSKEAKLSEKSEELNRLQTGLNQQQATQTDREEELSEMAAELGKREREANRLALGLKTRQEQMAEAEAKLVEREKSLNDRDGHLSHGEQMLGMNRAFLVRIAKELSSDKKKVRAKALEEFEAVELKHRLCEAAIRQEAERTR